METVGLPLQLRLRFGRLRQAKRRGDAEVERGRQPGRDAVGAEPAPVLHRTRVVVPVVRQEAAQQELPFEKRRLQADALKRFSGRVVLPGCHLGESLDDSIEICLQGFG